MDRPPMQWSVLSCTTLYLILTAFSGLTSEPSTEEPNEKELLDGKPFIYRLKRSHQEGYGYKLVYLVDAPIDIFWRFKTDFDNDFLVSNRFINYHQFLSRHGDIVITETIYTNKPSAKFKWQTTVSSNTYRLNYALLNPRECGQKFHYGSIQLEAIRQKTKVIQIAYFDFFGAFLWTTYPWRGGMSDFLQYHAHWEQKTILKLLDRYKQQN
jgi:hypothetical protein